jgi:hypothetical protein
MHKRCKDITAGAFHVHPLLPLLPLLMVLLFLHKKE